MEWDGTVLSKEDLARACTGRVIIQNSLRIDTIEGCNCGLAAAFWASIVVGDHLSKPKGETRITLHRETGSQSYDFPCCDH